MVKYLGSKRTLITHIVKLVQACPQAKTVVDLFSGTSRVGHAFKAAGYRVLANDHNSYAQLLATCYVQADLEDVEAEARRIILELNRLKGQAGYFTETFCEKSRYLQPKNGERVDAIRERIAELSVDPELNAVLLVSLMEAADRVDSTTGVQMAYLKEWSPRSYNELELRMPQVLPRGFHGKGCAYGEDVFEALEHLEGDVAYIDPPYNQHSYLGNYHVWETLARWDKPEVYGVACKRTDCKERGSVFNSKGRFKAAMQRVISTLKAPYLVVSFNNEGFLSRLELEDMLGSRGEVRVIECNYRRYVGAQIGIYNRQGRKVGRVSHLRNKEYLYVVSPESIELPLGLDAVAHSLASDRNLEKIGA